jgi:hypothetical protein
VAGYSGTPLPRKLGIKADSTVALSRAPQGFDETLGELPAGVRIRRAVRGKLDVIVAFYEERKDLERGMPSLRKSMQPHTGLWIAWPKRSSGVRTDITEDVVRELALANRLVDNKVCAIDETWSALRLVIRLADRPG